MPHLRSESFAVGVQQLLELSGCQQAAQRHAPEVVDEDIFRADQAIPLRPETHRIIVILEHADVVLLVERTDSLVGLAPDREAEHDEHRDLESLSRVPVGVLAGEPFELGVGAIGGLDLGLVADPVRHRPDRPDPRVVEVPDQPREPTMGHDRVIIEEDESVSRRQREPLVVRRREPSVGLVAHHPDEREAIRQLVEVGQQLLPRAIVHDDQLVVGVVGVREHALQAELAEDEIVSRDHDDADARV